MGRVRAYDRESIKSILLGSPNFTKLNKISSSICIRGFSWNMTYGSGRTLHIAGKLAFKFFKTNFFFFENNSRLQASLEQACITLFTISKLTTTSTRIKHMQPTELLGLLATYLYNQR